MKHEWKKHEKELYSVKKKPSVITVPEHKYIMINGKGNPNGTDFSERVGVLYSLAYPIKMRHKACCVKNSELIQVYPYEDYTVFPLEGIWTSSGNNPLDKSTLEYTIMIRQPNFITREMFEDASNVAEKKKPHPFLKEVVFGTMEDSLCVQILHVGPFDHEPASFEMMDIFSKENGFKRIDKVHREIYLNNANKTDPAKYQTILRYSVKKA
ncbi:MAG: GyrI-like domain-containing protein [Lachnospiraceae bacterium]